MFSRCVFIAHLALGVACTGCLDSTGAGALTREPATLATSGIVLPDSAVVGTPVTLTFQSLAPNGCYAIGETTVAVNGLVADVWPYRYVSHGGSCPQLPQTFTHTATVQFAVAGRAKVVIHGGDSLLERTVQVQTR